MKLVFTYSIHRIASISSHHSRRFQLYHINANKFNKYTHRFNFGNLQVVFSCMSIVSLMTMLTFLGRLLSGLYFLVIFSSSGELLALQQRILHLHNLYHLSLWNWSPSRHIRGLPRRKNVVRSFKYGSHNSPHVRSLVLGASEQLIIPAP